MTKPTILEELYRMRNGHFMNVIEVETGLDIIPVLESVSEEMYEQFIGLYSKEEIVEYLESIEIYILNEDEFEFDFKEYIDYLN